MTSETPISPVRDKCLLPLILLQNLLAQAFRIKNFKISGPDWLDTDRFDIVAKLPDGATQDQRPAMLQTLLRERFGLLRQNEESPGRYADMAGRFVGQPFVTRLYRRAALDPARARAVILMGPNARHVDPSILDVGTAPLTVTFDINVLVAQKPERKS